MQRAERYWLTLHGPLGVAVPALLRYVQSHTRSAAHERGREPAWDGTSITWFGDSAALRATTATREWERMKADDANFLVPGPIPFIVTTEHVVIA